MREGTLTKGKGKERLTYKVIMKVNSKKEWAWKETKKIESCWGKWNIMRKGWERELQTEAHSNKKSGHEEENDCQGD